MDYFVKKRFAFWGVILLVLMSLSSLVTVWYTQHHKPPALELQQLDRIADFLKNELGLTEEQANHATSLIKDHFKKVKGILYSIKDLHTELIKELFVKTPDVEKVERLTKEIGSKYSALEKLKFYHLLDLKNIGMPEQQKKMEKIFRDEVLREIGQPDIPPGQRPSQFPNEHHLPPRDSR